MEIPQEEFAQFIDTWEHRRQAYRTAEYFYCRERKTLEEIKSLTPLSQEELESYEPAMRQKREAYLSTVPSPFLKVKNILDERVAELVARNPQNIPLEKIQKLYDSLKPTATIFDQYELILNILTQHFLPIKHIDQMLEDQLIATLEEFRGFLKLQILSGNR